MRPPIAFLFNQKVILLLATFLIISAVLSTAAVSRSKEPYSFYSQQQSQEGGQPQTQQKQEQQQETSLATPATAAAEITQIQPTLAPQSETKAAPETTAIPEPVPAPATASSSSSSSSSSTTRAPAAPSHIIASPPKPVTNAPVNHPPAPPAPTVSRPPSPPPEPAQYKYFHESGFTYELAHYDRRFFRGVIPYGAHRAGLTHLVRSYLTTFAALNLETWLAHGTLLGWWWNGLTLPWDFDLDAQVSGETMRVLGERYNGSLHEYTYRNATTGKDETRVYLLDVNPFANEVSRGKGENVIDARWIDVKSGMFVDITGLMERDPKGKPGVVSCKNYHNYEKGELYPLKETEYEGVPALVPYAYEGILVAEYGEKSLVVTEYHDHRWDPAVKEWLQIPKEEIEKKKKAEEAKKKAAEEKKKAEEEKKKAEEVKKKAEEKEMPQDKEDTTEA